MSLSSSRLFFRFLLLGLRWGFAMLTAPVCSSYWLINMFVAVITNTFGSIMDETKHSAFASKTCVAPVPHCARRSD